MVDQFQAYLLLVVTALFVFIALRVVQDDRKRARRSRRPGSAIGTAKRSPPS